MLFGKDPNRWIIGSYIKIGFFAENDADLLYQDEIHGPLILQVDKAIDLIYLKYLKALIRYEDIQRIEEYMFPREAFREILLNSINHKQYEEGNAIQVSVYDDKIYVYNDSKFPKELASKNLFEKHFSKPYNPLIAQTFFKAGFIESWGRGFEKIKDECKKFNTPIPEITIQDNSMMVKCNPSDSYIKMLNEIKSKNVSENVPENVPENLSETENKIFSLILENPFISQYNTATILKISRKTVQRAISKLKDMKVIERVGSDKKGYWKILKNL